MDVSFFCVCDPTLFFISGVTPEINETKQTKHKPTLFSPTRPASPVRPLFFKCASPLHTLHTQPPCPEGWPPAPTASRAALPRPPRAAIRGGWAKTCSPA